MFNGNLKVAVIVGGFGKINTYKISPKVYYWWKYSLNLVARLRFFPDSKI